MLLRDHCRHFHVHYVFQCKLITNIAIYSLHNAQFELNQMYFMIGLLLYFFWKPFSKNKRIDINVRTQ